MNRNDILAAFCLVALPLTALTACSSSTEVDGLKVRDSDFQHYLCDDEKQFDVAYVSAENAVLKTSESLYRLVRIPSGSGEKYILDDHTSAVVNPVTLFTKGDDARLEVKGIIYKTCRTE
ncbi:MliC family protein [Vibrio diazotrophicus]|uniref:MliC family protein n=1 Tax=Vibrio diazotrophicus TaxID=685 RepID=UPI0022AEE67F|nr:MliC family protein [Vibrio diazotrophicus]MCZ4374201.1 MliC family protein [Vibrio diazotrophicus]